TISNYADQVATLDDRQLTKPARRHQCSCLGETLARADANRIWSHIIGCQHMGTPSFANGLPRKWPANESRLCRLWSYRSSRHQIATRRYNRYEPKCLDLSETKANGPAPAQTLRDPGD